MPSSSVSILDKLSQTEHALTASQVAQLLQLSRLTVYRLAKTARFLKATFPESNPSCPEMWLASNEIPGAV